MDPKSNKRRGFVFITFKEEEPVKKVLEKKFHTISGSKVRCPQLCVLGILLESWPLQAWIRHWVTSKSSPGYTLLFSALFAVLIGEGQVVLSFTELLGW